MADKNQILQDKGLSASDALRIVQVHSRDNGRTPMQWNDSAYAGFTSADSAVLRHLTIQYAPAVFRFFLFAFSG